MGPLWTGVIQMLFSHPGEGTVEASLQTKAQSPLPPRSQLRSAKIVSPFYGQVNWRHKVINLPKATQLVGS